MLESGERFSLMLTDVVMPRVSGRELADRAYEIDPWMPVLYMSGYTEDIISSHDVADEGHGVPQEAVHGARPTRDRGPLPRPLRVIRPQGRGDPDPEDRAGADLALDLERAAVELDQLLRDRDPEAASPTPRPPWTPGRSARRVARSRPRGSLRPCRRPRPRARRRPGEPGSGPARPPGEYLIAFEIRFAVACSKRSRSTSHSRPGVASTMSVTPPSWASCSRSCFEASSDAAISTRLGAKLELPRLDPREQEEVGDQELEPDRVSKRDGGELALRRIELAPLPRDQRLDVALDRGERRPAARARPS